ncbi:MAG: SocA family protein [Treponema sp.]|nr:SocA family protein [Treponema sp.]
MNRISYSCEKALQALYYLQAKTQITDKMSLVKLLFFADRFHVRTFCIPMLCDSYTAMRQGPVCSKTYDLIKKGQYFDYLPASQRQFVSKNLSCKKETVVTVLDTGSDCLSVSDKIALDFSIEHFSQFERKDLSKISHAYPEWNRYKTILETKFSNAEEMSYSDFFDNPELNDKYIQKYFNGIDPFEEDAEALKAKKEEFESVLCR